MRMRVNMRVPININNDLIYQAQLIVAIIKSRILLQFCSSLPLVGYLSPAPSSSVIISVLVMQYLNTFLSLLNRTQSRDKVLRIVQYATIYSEEHSQKGATFSTYTHIRRTRKWLRFFAWIQMLVKLKKLRREFRGCKDGCAKAGKALAMLEEICRVLFYLSDHLVLLGQLEILPKSMAVKYEPKSMLMYLLQNLFGALRNLAELMSIIQNGPQPKREGEEGYGREEDRAQGEREVRGRSIELLRCLLDLMVACYYLRRPKGAAHRVGIVGMVTSLMALAQQLDYI